MQAAEFFAPVFLKTLFATVGRDYLDIESVCKLEIKAELNVFFNRS